MSNRKGFSLIELLVAVVVIGILSALIYPKLNPVKDRSHIVAMKNSLNKVVLAQEVYFNTNQRFAPSYVITDSTIVSGYTPDEGVTITLTPSETTGKYGFTAIATHIKTEAQCGVAYGASGPGGTQYPGKVVCNSSGAPTAVQLGTN